MARKLRETGRRIDWGVGCSPHSLGYTDARNLLKPNGFSHAPFQPHIIKSFDVKGSPSAAEGNHYHIKLINATIASARAMAEGTSGFAAAQPARSGLVAHELTHTTQQRPAAQDGDTVTVNFSAVDWQYSVGPFPDMSLKSRAGSTVEVHAHGRKVLEGKLHSVEKADPSGQTWAVKIAAAKRY